MVVVGQMAARLNAANLESFSSGITTRERGRKFGNPAQAFERFSARARENLDSLRPKVERAEALLDRVRVRHESGELDLMAHGAEVASAKMITKLSSALESLYSRAKDARDIWAMRRLAVTADKLGVQADELLKESAYPSEPTVKKMIIAQKIGMAREVYDDILRSLDNTNRELGVSMPDFPATSL